MTDMSQPGLDLIQAFVSVADRLNFAAAAKSLNVTPSTLSRRIGALESRLGTRLFNRTTRRVALTEAGARFHRRCQRALDELRLAEAELASMAAAPQGLLRVHAPMSFGLMRLSPALPAFFDRYPGVDIDLVLSDAFVDLVQEHVDVAIRIGNLPDSSLIARKLAPNRRFLCASPAYLDRHGRPRRPEDLADHSCLNFTFLQSGDIWRLDGRDRTASVRVSGRLRANNALAVRDAALGGHGIVLLSDFIAGDDVAAGRLVRVLNAWAPAPSDIYAIYPSTGFMPPKARVFVDFLVARFTGRDKDAAKSPPSAAGASRR